MAIASDIRIHRDAARMKVHELAQTLNAGLGSTLVAALAGVSNRKQPNEWAKPNGPAPRPEALNRLEFAYRIWSVLEAEEGGEVARRWFIGGNPLLNEATPITAIREDRHADVRRAAQAFIDGDVDE